MEPGIILVSDSILLGSHALLLDGAVVDESGLLALKLLNTPFLDLAEGLEARSLAADAIVVDLAKQAGDIDFGDERRRLLDGCRLSSIIVQLDALEGSCRSHLLVDLPLRKLLFAHFRVRHFEFFLLKF